MKRRLPLVVARLGSMLRERTKGLPDRADRRLERQTALLNAAHVVTSDLSFDSVIRRLVEEVVSLLRADAADCWIFEPGRDLLRCRAVLGVPDSNVGRLLPPEGTIGKAIETGRPVLTHDFAETEDPPPSPPYAVFSDVMVAPITWLGEVRGALGVCDRRRGRFDESDVDVLEAFARFASISLHNAESFEERARQARVERAFFRVADALGSPLSRQETLNALAQAAAEALGARAGLVLEPDGDDLRLAASHALAPELAARLAAGVGASTGPFLARPGEERIVASGSLRDDDRFDVGWRDALRSAGYAALLIAPVPSGATLGHTVVVLFADERMFTDDEIALARHLADAARGALERSELFETERRAHALSQRLASVGARLVRNLEPNVVLDQVVAEAPRLLEADAAVIRLLEGDELVVHAAWGSNTEELVGSRASSGTGFLGDVAQSRAPVVVPDARSSPGAGRADPVIAVGAPACVAVPMIAQGGRLLGVIAVYCAKPRLWRDDEVQALAALAAVASAALANAELYQRVAEEKERNDAILANIADGIVAIDREERIVLWNATAEQITGVPVEEALGRRVAEVLQRDLAGDGSGSRERQLAIQRAGKEIWLSVTEAVMEDPAGGVAGRIFAFRDVSGERVVEQMKSDFVSTVSHELRTPLTSIYGFAETLLRSDVAFGEHERATFLGYIASESERLISIVDDLLNVARLDAGTLGVAIEDTDVGGVVNEVIGRFTAHVDGGDRFLVELPDGNLHVEADREKLAQVVGHLLDNAVKFSPAGGTITVSGRRTSGAVEVRVTDEGVGIPAADQQRIFTKFYRADSPPLSGVQGSGLGLFLVRGLLAAMNGRIWVESKEGEGSTFAFELPVSRPAARGRTPVETAGRS